jgi:hemoglobin-like flavoprotein
MSLNFEVLEESFERIKPHATQFSSCFYENFLFDYPQLSPLFAKTNMEEQQQKLVMSLVLIIENLRKPNYLNAILKNLGERHVRYGTIQEHYPMVGAALLKTFESYLGTDWTPEVKQAWIDAYEVLVNLMLEGAKYPQETVKEENILLSSAKPAVSDQASQQVSANTYSQETVKEENISLPRTEPIVSNQSSQQIFTTTSSLNYSQETVKEKSISLPNAKPVAKPEAQEQSHVKPSSLNLKLSLLLLVGLGLLGIGFLYYHSNSIQNKNSIEKTFSN